MGPKPLKACPFCGVSPRYVPGDVIDGRVYMEVVSCDECDYRIFSVENWNTRRRNRVVGRGV